MSNVKELNVNNTTYDIIGKGVVDQNNPSTPLKQWSGTKAQYDAIATKDANTLYNITDDEVITEFADTDLSNITATGQALFDAKANISLDNLTSTGKNITNWSTNVSNCITYIPQDIKLELNSGTLILKAGSKVYVPNGFEADGTTPKFDIKIIESDINATTFGTDMSVFQFVMDDDRVFSRGFHQVFSGSTAPTSTQYMIWYDTTHNLIKHTSDSGSTWTAGGDSFPISIATTVSSSYTSIDKIFNGFGIMGSTVFALPGVKGLIPNGRNADGTLNSTPFTMENVSTYTYTDTPTAHYYIQVKGNYVQRANKTGWTYDEKQNLVWWNGSTSPMTVALVGNMYMTSGKFTGISVPTPFHALDWNDSSHIATMSAPSPKYMEMSKGATGTTYTAPANGYVRARATSTVFLSIVLTNTALQWSNSANSTTTINVGSPLIAKGTVYRLDYTSTATLTDHRFVIAKGDIDA